MTAPDFDPALVEQAAHDLLPVLYPEDCEVPWRDGGMREQTCHHAARAVLTAVAPTLRAQGARAIRARVESVLDGPTISGADRKRIRQALTEDCGCPPCPGRGNDGHGLTHCAECCFGSGVEADPGCPVHGERTYQRGKVEGARQVFAAVEGAMCGDDCIDCAVAAREAVARIADGAPS